MDVDPHFGDYVTLVSGGSGQVVAMASGPKGIRYTVRLSATGIEQSMSKSQLKQVLTVKRQKD